MLSDAEGQTFRVVRGVSVARTLGTQQAIVLAALSAGLYVLGFAGVGCWPLSCVALVPVLFAIEYGTRSHMQLWATGWSFGVLTNLGGFYWLVPAMQHFWALSLGASLLLLLALCIWQGGLLALFVWLCGRARGYPLPLVALAALPALELLYPLVFPSYYGNALHAQRALIQIADLGGPLLVSAMLVLINAGAYELLRLAAPGGAANGGARCRRLRICTHPGLRCVANGADRTDDARGSQAHPGVGAGKRRGGHARGRGVARAEESPQALRVVGRQG